MTTREVQFQAGYDHRAEDATKPEGQRLGVHGLSIRFVVRGDEGAVQFLVYTDWLPSWVQNTGWNGDPRVEADPDPAVHRLFPMAADLGYHWPTPRYEDQPRMDRCDLLPQGYCYYDGSGLIAEPLLVALLTEGSDAVWSRLESYYAGLLERADA